MTSKTGFPALEGFEPTRQTLQLYSRVISAVPRAHGRFHPKWWHVSLKVPPDGLINEEVSLPDGGPPRLKMDLVGHEIILIPGSPGDAPYFYGNPWPFEGDALLGRSLPYGAGWHTEGWQGTILPYEALAGDPKAEERLLAFARRVFELSAPTLSADWVAGRDQTLPDELSQFRPQRF